MLLVLPFGLAADGGNGDDDLLLCFPDVVGCIKKHFLIKLLKKLLHMYVSAAPTPLEFG